MAGGGWATKDIRFEVAQRFGAFNKKERHKIVVLVQRLRFLENDIVEKPNDFKTAEIAALKWVLAELEAIEHPEENDG